MRAVLTRLPVFRLRAGKPPPFPRAFRVRAGIPPFSPRAFFFGGRGDGGACLFFVFGEPGLDVVVEFFGLGHADGMAALRVVGEADGKFEGRVAGGLGQAEGAGFVMHENLVLAVYDLGVVHEAGVGFEVIGYGG